MSQTLYVICPDLPKDSRAEKVLHAAVGRASCRFITTAAMLRPIAGQRVLFCLFIGKSGINLEWQRMLAAIRCDEKFFSGSVGAVMVDGETELYTKAAARQLMLAANGAGCGFIGAGLIEATGSLNNFKVRAKNGGCTLQQAYMQSAAELIERLLTFELQRHKKPKLLMLHASNRRTSNSMALWDKTAQSLCKEVAVTEIGLRNGVLVDCCGCPYTMCLHFGEKGECFYGGVMPEKVYPALKEVNGVVFICPNYNDALSANLTACINRMTALFRNMRFFDKALFAIVVSGYSGSDLVAEQLLGAVSMNKSFYLPPYFALMETANDAGSAMQLEGIDERVCAFAQRINETLCQTQDEKA